MIHQGPLYRPAMDEFRELQPPKVPPSRRNYTPGPAPIPLDSRVRPRADPQPMDLVGVIMQSKLASARERGRAESAKQGRIRGVHPNSIAGRAVTVLEAADDWLTAHQIYLILKREGKTGPIGEYRGIHSGRDVSGAIGWHVNRGAIWARSVKSTVNPARTAYAYRLARYAAEEQST